MNGFAVQLQSAVQCERLEDVVSFVGEDASGSFGLITRWFGIAGQVHRCGKFTVKDIAKKNHHGIRQPYKKIRCFVTHT